MIVTPLKRESNTDYRVPVCFFFIVLGFLSCILRVAVIAGGNYEAVQQKQSSYRIDISSLRGTIFDCNRIPITNAQTAEIAAVIPSTIAQITLKQAMNEKDFNSVKNYLAEDMPFTAEVNKKLKTENVVSVTTYKHNSSQTVAPHIIGYVDGEGHGVNGLEKAFDSILYSNEKVSAVFKTDGTGKLLKGEGIEIENNNTVVANGVVTTLDINIQSATEKAAEKIKKGAVVVIDVKSGKIRAMVSKPHYDVTDVAKYLDMADSPLYNRCISAYNVGSAFKPCVAAALLDSNKTAYSINCKGFEIITDRRFNCHERNGHGSVDLAKALSESCNVFFYNTALKLGYEKIYSLAKNLNFGYSINLCDGISTASGNLTSSELLKNEAELANLSIGQGRLLLTPVSILTLYSAIATDGTYRLPSLVEGILTDGKFKEEKTVSPTRVMTEKTASVLREYLGYVIEDGTGKAAKPKSCTAAGKTATAQTGKYENGIEITHSWFCGFFPANKPRFAVSVMVEGGTGSAEVFANVCDAITEISPNY